MGFVRLCGGPGKRYDSMRKALERRLRQLEALTRNIQEFGLLDPIREHRAASLPTS